MNNKVIMDTNVAVKAATPPGKCKEEELKMQKTCMKFIKNFTDNPESKLVIDTDYEIIREYRNRVPGNTNIGKIFWRWFNAYAGRISSEDIVKLEKDSDGNYLMFPMEQRTKDFDYSDRKFIALAKAHPEHPPIIEAADGKWLGYRDIFEEYGIHIKFLDLDYATMMYKRKIVDKRRS